jgi:hypothetical protein
MRNGVPWLRQPHFRSEGVQKTVDRYNADLRERLQAFETRYQLSSEDFYRRFHAGEMVDAMDVVEWSVF